MCHILPAVAKPKFNPAYDVVRIDEVHQWGEEGIEYRHYNFLFDDSMVGIVVEDDGFNHQSHEGSRKEHPQHVLESEREL